MEDLIKSFLSVSYGYGYGSGSGDGSGYGSGYGYGSGDGLMKYDNKKVYKIDRVPTIIVSVHSNYAKGYIITPNLTLKPCYVAKAGNFFAHGATLKEALRDATNKYTLSKPAEERITEFIHAYPSLDSIAEHKDLYLWHHILTGSCALGRNQFIKEHNLDKDNGTMSIRDFIELTKDAYGGSIIKQLAEAY